MHVRYSKFSSFFCLFTYSLPNLQRFFAFQKKTNLWRLGASKNENETLKNAQQLVTDSVMNARTVQALGVEESLVTMYVGWVDKCPGSTRKDVGWLVGWVYVG